MRSCKFVALSSLLFLLGLAGAASASSPASAPAPTEAVFSTASVERFSGDAKETYARLIEQVRSQSRFDGLWKDPPKGTVSRTIDCDAGQSLAAALRSNPIRKTLEIGFRGTCEEDVTIARDFTRLHGLEEGATIAGALNVTGSAGVVLTDLTVRDSATRGISIADGSVAFLQNIVATANGLQGLFLASSAATLVNGRFEGNTADGVAVTRGSELLITGELIGNDNGGSGLLAFASSTIFASNFRIETRNNGVGGMVVQVVSSGTFVGGEILSEGNPLAGLVLASGGVVTEGFTSTTLRGNGLSGGALTDSSSWLTFVGAGVEKDLSGNGVYGIRAESDSTVDFRGETNAISITGNPGAGITLVNGTGRFEGTTSRDNGGADMAVYFGALGIIFGENDIDVVVCAPGAMIDVRDDVSGFDSTGFTLCPDETGAAAEKRFQEMHLELAPIGVVPVR